MVTTPNHPLSEDKKPQDDLGFHRWAVRDLNPRPLACQPDKRHVGLCWQIPDCAI